ncbi:MAG: hypothetical protein N3D72_02850, partial [Candidatus Methanomethyliaceae archaeon]|nr:hypothetical protein [Candidatus Methanomethyliaceae archaeon]
VMVDENWEKIIHTSSVQWPIFEDQMEFLIRNKPRTLIVDGPMIYMLGYKYSYENLLSSIKNLEFLLENGVKELIIDHHMLRDLNYIQIMNKLREKFPNQKITTAAEYMGMQVELLEARRRELFKKEPIAYEGRDKAESLEGNDG